MNQESSRHHFVPKLLLRHWLQAYHKEQLLFGYYWNTRNNQLSCKRKGLDGFCFQLDLLTLIAHHLGRDVIEKIFLGEVDSKGAIVRDILIDSGPQNLNEYQRCDFARLLLSLEARRPKIVSKYKEEALSLAKGLDGDSRIIDAMKDAGISDTPSVYYEKNSGVFLIDIVLAGIQRFVDNAEVGGRLINAWWHIVRLSENEESLVLSDRPLIRIEGYDHPHAIWYLPLTPKALFVAANDKKDLERIKRVSPNRLARTMNVASVHQTERFVFTVKDSQTPWIEKHLRTSS